MLLSGHIAIRRFFCLSVYTHGHIHYSEMSLFVFFFPPPPPPRYPRFRSRLIIFALNES